MSVHLRILLILTQLTGLYGISRITRVSVKAGGSVSIPCPYQSSYRNHVKYLCEGNTWRSCTDAVKTNRPDTSRKFSISDDKNKGIFTVTINKLTVQNTDFWCIVEINHGTDDGKEFHLAVTEGTPSLYVDRQDIQGYIGDDITVRCYHDSPGNMQWCRLGEDCVTGPRGEMDGKEVTINSTIPRVSTVTMSKVTIQSSGWYACVQGAQQMPVYVTLNERPVTTTVTSAPSTTPGSGGGEKAERSSLSVLLMSLIIPLSLLIVVVTVTLFVWLSLKKHRTSNSQSSAMAMGPCESDADVLYSSVVFTKPQTGKAKEQVKAQDEDLIYSTVSVTNCQT